MRAPQTKLSALIHEMWTEHETRKCELNTLNYTISDAKKRWPSSSTSTIRWEDDAVVLDDDKWVNRRPAGAAPPPPTPSEAWTCTPRDKPRLKMPTVLIFVGAWQHHQPLAQNRHATSSGENIGHKISYLWYFLLYAVWLILDDLWWKCSLEIIMWRAWLGGYIKMRAPKTKLRCLIHEMGTEHNNANRKL
jgi:hypothetical protein